MSKVKKIIYIVLVTLIFVLLGTIKSNAGDLNFNNLDFQVQINADGSMNVTENWNIHIRDTNTLYKTFKTDSSKYSEITNVTVEEITGGEEVDFANSHKWEYHVTKGYYYGTKNREGDFEIGWGVDLENKEATKQYLISYTVKDAITKYNDYAELYWQFLGKDFEISADKITGTIYLPSNASSLDEIKVWGHTEGLNGTIYATDLDKIEFEVDKYRGYRYLEVRTLFPTNLITTTAKIKNQDILQTAITEETKWANEANARRERNEFISKLIPYVVLAIVGIINIILIIVFISKARKYKKYLKTLNKYEPTTKLEYYRELPDQNITPGEAFKIVETTTMAFTPTNFGKIFSATMLDLTLKGYIEIQQDKGSLGKNKFKIIIKDKSEELKPDEQNILEFIKHATKGKNEITLKELQRYIERNTSKIITLLDRTFDRITAQLSSESILDKKIEKEYKSYYNKFEGFCVTAVFCIIFVAFVLPGILAIINAVLCNKIMKRLNILTQKGIDEKEELNGLIKYMKDFSLLKEREVPELVLWEKYLVFATVFGIADKVVKQLELVYPNLEETLSNDLITYSYINMMVNTDFSKSFSNSISASFSSAYSSGSGSGGGFSGGGGFGRRPEVAVAGR